MITEHQIVIEIRLPGRILTRRRDLGIRFDMLAFFRMLEEFGIGLGDDISALGKVPYDEMIAVAIYTGAESYCFHTKKNKWFDRAGVLGWVDDSVITRGHMKQISELWAEFMKDYADVNKKKVKAQ
jgi:hypothetical protein